MWWCRVLVVRAAGGVSFETRRRRTQPVKTGTDVTLTWHPAFLLGCASGRAMGLVNTALGSLWIDSVGQFQPEKVALEA